MIQGTNFLLKKSRRDFAGLVHAAVPEAAVSPAFDKWFTTRRNFLLQSLATATHDRSIAKCVDEGVRRIVDSVNEYPQFVTLSSCSGRMSLFHRTSTTATAAGGDPTTGESEGVKPTSDASSKPHRKRGNGKGTILSSHSPASDTAAFAAQVVSELQLGSGAEGGMAQSASFPFGLVEFKFEPFILHVLCRTLGDASLLLQCGLESGYRHSGIIAPVMRIGLPHSAEIGRRIVCVLSGGFGFSVPVVLEGQSVFPVCPGTSLNANALVAVEIWVKQCNLLFAENERRKARFLRSLSCCAVKSVTSAAKVPREGPAALRTAAKDDDVSSFFSL